MTAAAAEQPSGRFDSLQLPAFRRLLLGSIASFLSMMVATTARSWLAFDLTGTNTALGAVILGFGISSVIMIPIGGVVADRLPKRRVLMVTATIQALVSLALATLVVTDQVAFWMLIVASLIQGGAISLLGPARLALIAEVVDRDHLTNGMLLSQSGMQLARVFGPAVAGALIGIRYIGVGGVYYIAAGLAVVGLGLTFGLPEGRPLHPPTRSPLADLADGARFVRNNGRIARLLIVSYLIVLVGFPHAAFLPVVAEDLFDAGSTGFGLLTTASALGALAVSLSLANIAPSRVPAFQAGAAVVFGVSLMAFGAAPGFISALAAIAVVGAGSSAFQSLNNSLVLTSTPVEYHGRVQSLLMLGFSGFGLAALPIGLVADAVGLRETLVTTGVLVTIVAIGSIILERRHRPSGAVRL